MAHARWRLLALTPAAGCGLRSLAAGALGVVARGDTAATVSAVSAKRAASPDALVALTGGSELVTAVRDALRRDGVREVKTKAYWIPGRTGLDRAVEASHLFAAVARG